MLHLNWSQHETKNSLGFSNMRDIVSGLWSSALIVITSSFAAHFRSLDKCARLMPMERLRSHLNLSKEWGSNWRDTSATWLESIDWRHRPSEEEQSKLTFERRSFTDSRIFLRRTPCDSLSSNMLLTWWWREVKEGVLVREVEVVEAKEQREEEWSNPLQWFFEWRSRFSSIV